MRLFIYSLIIIVSYSSCSHIEYSNELNKALSLSGSNRKELEKVLYHFENDSLKLEAVKFLIKYMPYYSYQEVLSEFEPVFDSLALEPMGGDAGRKYLYIKLLDSIVDKGGIRTGRTKYDIQEISAEFLIENIDLAFYAWQEIPEVKRADFKTFCDYILPYRNMDEPLEPDARRYLYNKYKWVQDELHKGTPVREVIDSVLSGFHYGFVNDVRDYYPSALSVLQFDRSRLGLCQDAVTYFVNVFRSVGIACSNEYLPQWGTHHTNGHSWLYFWYGDENFAFDADGDGDDVRVKFIGESVPKVYRRTYAQLNPASLFREGRDVTASYWPVIDFELDASVISLSDTSIKYTVNVYHATKGWAPVAEMLWMSEDQEQFRYPDKEHDRLICRDLGINTLYIAGLWENEKLYPFTAPFYVKIDGQIHDFKPEKVLLDSVRLLRKYGLASPRNRAKVHWIRVLENGTIQGAQDSTFAYADTLFKIENFWSTHLKTYPVDSHSYGALSDKAYQYVRFAPAQDKAYLAELAFYDRNGRKLEGEVISDNIEAGKVDTAVFDGNPLTYAGGTDFYVGYAFDEPVHIHSIAFQARNDDNHIRVGDDYELRYWDRKWKSLGTQIASDTVLYFSNVPKNALLLLKDLTRGSEEIPFRINDQKEQEWMGFYNY